MASAPLSIPETKPATEYVDGVLLRKMSPYGLHARVQLAIGAALRQWAEARGRGRVGTEWDFDLTPPGESTHRLVPDVAYLSYDRVAYDDEAGARVPAIAPNVAVEILSEGQSLENSQRRIEIFLACGCELIVLVDPRREEAWLVDAGGVARLTREMNVEHAALREFSLPLRSCFENARPGGSPAA